MEIERYPSAIKAIASMGRGDLPAQREIDVMGLRLGGDVIQQAQGGRAQAIEAARNPVVLPVCREKELEQIVAAH